MKFYHVTAIGETAADGCGIFDGGSFASLEEAKRAAWAWAFRCYHDLGAVEVYVGPEGYNFYPPDPSKYRLVFAILPYGRVEEYGE